MVPSDLSPIRSFRDSNNLHDVSKLRGIFRYWFLFLVPLILIPGLAYGDEFFFTHFNPTWYSYDCSNGSPTVFTKQSPGVSQFKYFNFISDDSQCFAILFSYDIENLDELTITNATTTTKTRSELITDNSLNTAYTMNCELYWFETNIDTDDTSFTQAPTIIDASRSCTIVNSTFNHILTDEYDWSAGEESDLQTDLTADDYFIHLMLFPVRNASMITDLDTNNYEWGLQNTYNEQYLNGTGVFCWTVKESRLCNFPEDPWNAVGKALGSDYIGDWFYVLVFFPFPMAIFLITRVGTYAGFTGLGIMLVIETIDQTVFEIALSMIFISGGFAFYDIVRKKLLE